MQSKSNFANDTAVPISSCYSSAVKKRNKEVVIIKPKDDKQSSEITRKEIEEKVDPSSLGEGISVSKVKYIREGGVAIKYSEDRNVNVQNICNSIKSTLGQSYDVKVPEKMNPRVILFNIHSKELEDEENLIQKIITQNAITTNPDIREIKIVHKYQNMRELNNMVIQLDKQTYECLVELRKEKLAIGWKTHFFRDSLSVRQCFNCWKFGHTAKDSRNTKPTCQICAAEHETSECQSSNQGCVSCKYAAEVLKLPNIEWKHKADDRNCETYKRVVAQLQEKIDYPELYNKQMKI